MKKLLADRKIERVFTFGCSFTGYAWMCWPEVIAYDLDVPLFNYGKSGAGNQYIFNMLMQAHNHYKFNENDLVIVSWTNVYRDDRFIKNQWMTPGNIYAHNGWFTPEYVEKYCDPEGFLLRDMAVISAVDKILSVCGSQYHFLSMNDFTDYWNQFSNGKFPGHQLALQIKDLYKNDIEKILPSFYRVLWNNDLDVKVQQENKMFGGNFADRHPHPQEHLDYLQAVFEHDFSNKTVQQVANLYQIWFHIIDSQPKDKTIYTYHLDKNTFECLRSSTTLVESQKIFQI